MLLKADKVIENRKDILETSSLIIDMFEELRLKHKDVSPEYVKWGLEQAVMRLSLRTGHDFGNPV